MAAGPSGAARPFRTSKFRRTHPRAGDRHHRPIQALLAAARLPARAEPMLGRPARADGPRRGVARTPSFGFARGTWFRDVSRRGRNALARDRARGNASDPQDDDGPQVMLTNRSAWATGR